MAAEAEFKRVKTDAGVEYTITPAATSVRYSITAWLLVTVIAGVLTIQIFNTKGLVSLACAAGALLVLALAFFRLRDDKAARGQQTVLTISKAELAVAGKSYELGDIAELFLVSPEGQAIGRSGILVGGEGAVAGVAMGATVGIGAAMAVIDGAVAAQAARSWSIALRRRSGSKAVVIVSHLTEEPGSALLNDLAKTIRSI